MLAFGTFDLKGSRECITVKLCSGLEDKWQTLASFSLERQRAKDKRGIFLLCLQLYALIDFNAIKKKTNPVTLNDRHILVRPGPLNSM